jgi:hypothetical protein
MKKLFTLLIMVLFVCSVQAERPTGVIKKAKSAIEIDGTLEAEWDNANTYDIDKPFQQEVPTLGSPGETTWRALWDATGIYVFLTVKDDQWFPIYLGTGSNHWEYDKPEIYFDVNYILEDGKGPGTGNQKGHYQVAPAPVAAKINGEPTTESDDGVIWAFKVTGGSYTAEYFIPWGKLLDEDNKLFDKRDKMGFDVTIIDRDPGDASRRRAVWANIGGKNESYSNMDDAGHVIFDEADANTLIEKITLSGGNTITENKGVLQLSATILPEDATVKTLLWTIENTPGQTGRAKIDNTGKVEALVDGEITVVASAIDGSNEEASIVITLTNQKPTRWDYNLIKNGLFIQADGPVNNWGGWIDGVGESAKVIEGEAVLEVTSVGMDGDNIVAWRYQFNQTNLGALPNIPYVFSFVARGAVDRQITVDFEDTGGDGGNNYNRYGASPEGKGGRSEWDVDLTTESQTFTFSVTFDQMVESTVQKVQFMVSQAIGAVYLDSILLISEADLALASPDDYGTNINPNVLSNLRVYPNPFNNTINISNTENVRRVAITNIVGQRVLDMEVSGDTSIDTGSLNTGVYFMIFEGNNGQRLVQKMIKR